MKLKKLIPLAGMTGIAAVMAPLLGSCANKGTEIVWNKGDDLPEVGTPSTTSFKNTDEATKAYFEAIDNDKTLLSKDILLSNLASNYYFDTISTMSVRTDSVDVANQKVSYTNKIEYKTEMYGDTSAVYEAKNVEFCITQVHITNPEEITITYFQPTLMKEVEIAYNLIHQVSPDPQEVTQAIEVVMNHAEELARDNSWYFNISSESESYTFSQRIDASNVYEYAYTISGDYTSMTLTNFANYSIYFADIEIGGR